MNISEQDIMQMIFLKVEHLVHEVGHWLGLRHIWGDGGCGVDDFCEDTPLQGSSSSGCPAVSQVSCATSRYVSKLYGLYG